MELHAVTVLLSKLSKHLRSLILSVCTLTGASVVHADVITLVADPWCPYNCDPESYEQGYMVEIASIILSRHGHQVRYAIVPWARAIKDTRVGKYTGIIGTAFDDAPDFIYPDNELGKISFDVFVLKDNPWQYKDLNSLLGVSLGIIRHYEYSMTINSYIDEHYGNPNRIQIASGNNALEVNINKLIAGRFDAVLANKYVMEYKLDKLSLTESLRSAGQATTADKAYIAFSPALEESNQYAKLLSQGIDDLRENGELKNILKHYGLTDWK